ncbi:MAG: hypothetical protein LOD87_05505 [Planifilum fulgidum]
MKIINILGAFIVLGCNLWVSFTHTLDLFRAGGFSGGLEIIATVGVETVFLMGAFNIVVSRLRGVSPGVPAILGGLLGVALVSWSNVSAGWEYGITGILLGLATPASLIVAEAILSREAIQRRRAGEKQETSPAKSPSPTPVGGEAGGEREKAAGEKKWESAAKRETAHTSPAEPKREKPATPAINKAGEQHRETDSPASSSPAPTNPGEPKREKESADTTPPAPADLSHLVEVAREIMEREGRPPGRRRLAEMTGASEWECRRALAALRKGA